MNHPYKIDHSDSYNPIDSAHVDFYSPDKMLNSLVLQYVYGTISDLKITEYVARPFSTGNIVMYLHFASPIEIYDSNFQQPKTYSSFVAGIFPLNKLFYMIATGRIENIVIIFKPGGFYSVFQVSANKLKNCVVNLTDFKNVNGAQLIRDCKNAISIKDKISLIDDFFLHCLVKTKKHTETSKFEELPNYIQERSGAVILDQICEEFSLSMRSVERYFNQYIGISPKEYIDIIRFNSILNYLLKSDLVVWQEIIYTLGYYDQSHFIKSFKAISGFTPSEYIRDNKHKTVLLDRFQILQKRSDFLHKTNTSF